MSTTSGIEYESGGYLRNILTTATAWVVLSIPVYSQPGLMPSIFHEIKNNVAIYDRNKSLIDSLTYYDINENKESIARLRIINKFVARVVNESEDLDPSVAKLINKNFWNLV